MNKEKRGMIENTVLEILKNNIESRKDDFILISKVLEVTNPQTKDMTIGEVLLKAKELSLPPFSSITRARRKVFKKHPELVPEDIKRIRKKEEQDYKEWSKEK